METRGMTGKGNAKTEEICDGVALCDCSEMEKHSYESVGAEKF